MDFIFYFGEVFTLTSMLLLIVGDKPGVAPIINPPIVPPMSKSIDVNVKTSPK